eukprot:TRINITY_DN7866_c0_g1_i1.p1 TRINITY_DN7866_c0_g1~~TRINITY_DN7866_c0_g1_i1.p1  ORF type:complete len:328 (-),score=31.45 TRINITY_DN7866_c0_g1_i1:812-1795(-)
MLLTEEVIKALKIARVSHAQQSQDHEKFNSLSFHRTRDLLVTANDGGTLTVYDTTIGEATRVIFSQKYGVGNVCYTHAETAILHSSTQGQDNSIRYLSVHENKYLRYFRGHEGRVTSLCMNPKNDMFISAAQDKTVRLWDLRSDQAQGLLKDLPGYPCCSFDEQGLVFAVAVESGVVKLYDCNDCSRGPFDTFLIKDLVNTPNAISCLKFSNDGKDLLAVSGPNIYVLDAFTGDQIHKFSNGMRPESQPMEASFTPDCKYLLSGMVDKAIRVWNLKSGKVVSDLRGHAGFPSCVQWAPQRMLVASACHALALWIPDLTMLKSTEQVD